ncbi:hypothetical protein MHBO_003434, partial [Bonamia ostreae]
MNVSVNLPVIKDVRIDLFKRPQEYIQNLVYTKAQNDLKNLLHESHLEFILTGEDQLTKSAPSVADETTKIDADNAAAIAALSSAIYAKFLTVPENNTDSEFAEQIKPTGKQGTGWLYGASVAGTEGLDYAQVAQELLRNNSHNPPRLAEHFEINNIQAKVYLLLKDH